MRSLQKEEVMVTIKYKSIVSYSIRYWVLGIGKEEEVGEIKNKLGTEPIVFYSIRYWVLDIGMEEEVGEIKDKVGIEPIVLYSIRYWVLGIGKELEVGGIKDGLGTQPIVFYSIRYWVLGIGMEEEVGGIKDGLGTQPIVLSIIFHNIAQYSVSHLHGNSRGDTSWSYILTFADRRFARKKWVSGSESHTATDSCRIFRAESTCPSL